jgi:hypothetical protein
MGVLLSRNPLQGGSVVVRVTFRDESGLVYVPVEGSVFYALAALDAGRETWTVVKSWTALPSSSIVDVVLQGQDLELLPSCVLKRRIVLQWRYVRGGEEVVGRDMVDFEVVPLPVTDPPLGLPPPLPSPPEPVPVEDILDGLEGYDSSLNFSVRVAGGFIKMSQGPVLAGDVASGLWVFVYSFSGPGEVQLVGVHGDTHEVSQPVFRAVVKVVGGQWTLVRVDENDMGLEAGTVFNFQPVSS